MVTNGDKIPDKTVADYYQYKAIESLLMVLAQKTFTYSDCVVAVLYSK